MNNKSLLRNPFVLLSGLMTMLNLIGGNVPMSILFAVLFFGNITVQKLDDIEEEKRRLRKSKERKTRKIEEKKDNTKEYTKKLSNNTKKTEEEIIDEILFNILLLENKYEITFEKDVNTIKKIINLLLDKLIEEKEMIYSKKEIINEINNTIENIFKKAKNNNIKIIKEEYIKQILNIKNNKEYYFETTIKKEKSIYDI